MKTTSRPMAIKVFEFGQAIRATHEFWARFEYNGTMMAISLTAEQALSCLESAGFEVPTVLPYIPQGANYKAQATADAVDGILAEYDEQAAAGLIRQAMLDKALASQAEAVFYDITAAPAPVKIPVLIF